LIIIIDNRIFVIDYPSFKIKSGWYDYPLVDLGVPQEKKINYIFNSYTGKAFIFYDNFYSLELEECLYRGKTHGMIYDLFPGLPSGINNAFRYANGLLYQFLSK
jgi:hypothetical protein